MTREDDELILINHLGPWEASKQKFLQGLSPQDHALFKKWLGNQSSPEQLQKDVCQLQNHKALEKLKPFIDGLQALDSVISPVAGLDSTGAGVIVWGSVKVFMTLATTTIDFFESIQDFLNDIGFELSHFREYETLYSKHGSSRFNTSLHQVFSTYLYFCSAIHDFHKASKWRKVKEATGFARSKHSSNIDLAIAEVKVACSRAKADVDLVEKQVQGAANSVIVDGILQIDESMRKLQLEMHQGFGDLHQLMERQRKSIEQRKFNDWLLKDKVDDLNMELELLNYVRKRDSLPLTCTWAFADESIKSWASSSPDSAKVLWIKADAGFGKSVLTSYIIKEMQKLHPTGIAYFFCKHDVQQKSSILWILKIWAWQLLSQNSIGDEIAPSHLSFDPTLIADFSSGGDATILAMSRVFRKLFRHDKPTRLIVDGLDECPSPTKEDMKDWDAFFDLLAQMPPQWKVLIVSRPHNWYNSKLEEKLGDQLKEKVITTNDNEDDLRDFALYRVEECGNANMWPEPTKEKTRDLMLSKAQGNLMWVYLLSETLAYSGPDEIEDILSQPPKGLGELYGRALKSLSRQNKGLAAKVRLALRWILSSYRPLRSSELEEILSMSVAATKENIFRIIGPLIRIEGEKSEIRLVHASARDYLVSADAEVFEDDVESESEQMAHNHAVILKKCLNYLSAKERTFVEVGSDQNAAIVRFRQHLVEHKLLEYACNGWIQHLVEAYQKPETLEGIKADLDRMLGSNEAVLKWAQVFHFLYNVAAQSDTARFYIGRATYHPLGRFKWVDFMKNNFPAFIAHLGYEDGRKYTRWDRFMIRHHEYTSGSPGNMHQTPRILPAICVAAFFDYGEEVEYMIKAGIDVNHKGPLGGTPLHWAATGGACRAIQVLLNHGANKEATYGRHDETPIFRALRYSSTLPVGPGYFPAARLLLDQGVKLEHEPRSNGFLASTALTALVETGPDCPGAVELVEKLGIRDEAVHGFHIRHGTISQVAVWYNRQQMLKELLKHPMQQAFLNYQGTNTHNRTVLHDACTKDNPEIAKILLNAGADPNIKSVLNGYTSLHFSICAGGKTTKILLDHQRPGIPCISDEITGWPHELAAFEGKQLPIHLAARYDTNVELGKLIQYGCHVDQLDGNGDTPLAIALENSNFQFAKKLLDLGADPSKISHLLRIYLPLQERDKRLLEIRKKHWKAVDSYAYVYYFRQMSRRQIPIPIIDRILRFAEHTDVLELSRKGRMSVNDHITQQIPKPYLMSPPIMGDAQNAVRQIEMFVHSRDQGHSNEGENNSLSKLVKLTPNLEMTSFNPEFVFGRNRHQWNDHHHTVTRIKKDSPQRLTSIHRGDRLAIFPYAKSPTIENVTDRAEIKVRQITLRGNFTPKEREQLWGGHQDGTPTGLNCRRRRCPRCAAEKMLEDWAQPWPERGPGHDLRGGEMQHFIYHFGLLKNEVLLKT